jgi:hypothetical protein
VRRAAILIAAQSYRVRSVATSLGKGGRVARQPARLVITGEFNPPRRVGEVTTSQGVEARYVGGQMYVRGPLLRAFKAAYVQAHKTPFPPGKSWLGFPEEQGPGQAGVEVFFFGSSWAGLGQAGPKDLLALLRSVSQARELGPASGPGWGGRQYSFVSAMTMVPSYTVLSMHGTVDIDQEGRVRRWEAVESAGKTAVRVDVTFGDFGVHVLVAAPPASQTFRPGAF